MAKKIPLSIKVDSSSSYLPTWGVREGLRELVQNAKDAEVEFNAPMKIEWSNNKLKIINEGCTITKEALLFGHTTKFSNKSLIGQFGEGLKLAFLVFAREGLNLKVFTADEIWEPTIENSDVFGAKVLTINIRSAVYKNIVKIEVDGITKEDWEKYSHDYLFINKPQKDNIVSCPSGDILYGDYVGKIYVKGVFVETKDTLWGYNFNCAELDRDRKMINFWSYEDNKAKIIDEAIKLEKIKPLDVFNMLEINSEDTRGYYFQSNLQNCSAEKIKLSFEDKYGKNAVAVQNDSEAIQIGHLNPQLKPIVVPETLGKILQKQYGTFEQIKTKLINETLKVYSIDELPKNEIFNLSWSLGCVNFILRELNLDIISKSGITICDFRSSNLLGQYLSCGQVKLSKSILYDRNLTLKVLIHEVAHRFGNDAEKSHVSMIEKFWSVLVGKLTEDMNYEKQKSDN